MAKTNFDKNAGLRALDGIELTDDVAPTDEQTDAVLATAFEADLPWVQSIEDTTPPFFAALVGQPLRWRLTDTDGDEHDFGFAHLSVSIIALANERGVSFAEFVEQHDAADADVVLQRAIYGEVVYG